MTADAAAQRWDEVKSRLEREWADALAQLARARDSGDFTGWKPSADR